ncbi:MAG: hypothetical protein AB1489_23690 [Acidobacteriota bacterium]
MKISKAIISYYLADVTLAWFNNNDLPPKDIFQYHHCIMQMQLGAISHGDLNELRLAFEYLLANPQINCEEFAGDRYPYDDKEVREIIHYAWQTIWPDAQPIPPGGPVDVELINTSLDDWWAQRKY